MNFVFGRCKLIDILEDSGLGLAPCWSGLPPEQFGLHQFEEGLDGGIVKAIALAAHRWPQPVFLHAFLIVIGAILAAAISMKDTAFWRSAQVGGQMSTTLR